MIAALFWIFIGAVIGTCNHVRFSKLGAGAWGWLAGAARKGVALAAKPANAAPTLQEPPSMGVSSSSKAPDAALPPRKPIDWGKEIQHVLGFLWRWKWLILFITLFFFGVGAMRGCTMPFGKSAGELRLERELAEGETETQKTINERDTGIAAIGQDVALLRQEIHNLAQRGRNDLAAAAPANQAPIDPELVRVWRANLDGMCVPRADGSRADSCAL